MTDGGALVRLHASTVAFQSGDAWHALALLGRSGAGKSELALTLMAMGARLVADDQTEFHREDAQIIARAPAQVAGLIELRFMGLLRADPVPEARLRAVVDMDHRELQRMPTPRRYSLLGRQVAMFHRIDSPAFASGLRQYMLYGAPEQIAFGEDTP